MKCSPASGRRFVAGLMSGTSCDGHTGALAELKGKRPWVRLLAWGHSPYPAEFRHSLLMLASARPAPAREFALVSQRLAANGAGLIRRLLIKAGISPRRLHCLGFHGHTLFHGPRERPRPASWQAGDLSLLAEAAGVTVVGDFRSRDIAAGGEGAPLAPFGHWLLFVHPRRPRIILNLGGIANVTWLPAAASSRQVRAFDTGPGNMLMDSLAGIYSRGRQRLDRNGALAARGRVDIRVLRRLLSSPFFVRRPPKSTGREEFGNSLLGLFRRLSAADALSTAAQFTAVTIARQISRWLPGAAGRAEVFVGGGGARNSELVRRLRILLAPRKILPISRLGMPEQALEPVCFALLADARLGNRPNVFPQATGARRAVCAGVIAPIK